MGYAIKCFVRPVNCMSEYVRDVIEKISFQYSGMISFFFKLNFTENKKRNVPHITFFISCMNQHTKS